MLEPVWMALADAGPERRFVQGLVQLANGRLKLRMERPGATLRLVGMARELVPSGAEGERVMTVRTREVHRWIDALERDARDGP